MHILLSADWFEMMCLFIPGVGGSGALKTTVSAQFQKQLSDLMSTLNSTQPHYIRCIKPNTNKASDELASSLVLQQLKYAGVFEAVQIRKSGNCLFFSAPSLLLN
jgi:myosin heavy subunit